MADAMQHRGHWPVLRSLAGWQGRNLGGDLAAGLTLAAIAVPEQMATAKLGGFAPELGLFVFVAGTIAFALFGAHRTLSSGADSTIAPIFAGTLGALAAPGSAAYVGLAAALAIGTGVLVMLGGLARLGRIASFLSVPVTTGFLAGIAVHIAASQLPALLGLAAPGGNLVARLFWLVQHVGQTNLYALLVGSLVFVAAYASEKLPWHIPGALIGLVAAMLFVGLSKHNHVAVVGARTPEWPHPGLPAIQAQDLGNLASLVFVVAAIVVLQTAATTRAFASSGQTQDVDRDFIGVGAGSLLAGLFGLFPVNASPPRTEAVAESGGRSQVAGLAAAILVGLLAVFGTSLLRYVPLAALAGVLLAIAFRLVRLSTFSRVLRETPAEFLLILATTAAIVVLPIQTGVAVGIALSLLHGIWTITRTRLIAFERVPGTSVWWPPNEEIRGETLAHVCVLGFQAPLSFLNADEFLSGMTETIEGARPSLIVFEASGVAEIDFTAAQVLAEVIDRCHEAGIKFAIARLTSLRAQQALHRFGISENLGPHGIYRSVDEAIRALAPEPHDNS